METKLLVAAFVIFAIVETASFINNMFVVRKNYITYAEQIEFLKGELVKYKSDKERLEKMLSIQADVLVGKLAITGFKLDLDGNFSPITAEKKKLVSKKSR